METKKCARCGKILPLTEFKLKNDKPYCWCILCTREYLRNKMREYRQNPDVLRPRNRDYLQLPPATEILNMINASTITEVAKQLDCHVMTVVGRLKKAGLYHSFTKKTRTTIDVEVLRDLYFNKGKSFNDIRRDFGCTMWYLQSTFRKQGWKPRPPGRRGKKVKPTILVINTSVGSSAIKAA